MALVATPRLSNAARFRAASTLNPECWPLLPAVPSVSPARSNHVSWVLGFVVPPQYVTIPVFETENVGLNGLP